MVVSSSFVIKLLIADLSLTCKLPSSSIDWIRLMYVPLYEVDCIVLIVLKIYSEIPSSW